ncbi:type II secretion system protein GspG (plasmid) [Paraburkholderia strydomiana]
MPELINSQRRIPKATYVPRTIPAGAQAASGRVIEKTAFLRSMDIRPEELRAIASVRAVKSLKAREAGTGADRPLIDVVRDFLSASAVAGLRRYGPAFARVSMLDIAKVGEAVALVRAESASALREAVHKVDNLRSTIGAAGNAGAGLPAEAAEPHPPTPLATIRGRPAGDAERATALEASSKVMAALEDIQAASDKASRLVSQFKYQVPLAPVGQIHLERLEMTPVGMEHGELVHSIPLTPTETVNVSHREWSQSTQSYETLALEALEGFSETGVTEKHDLARASEVEAKHSSSLDVSGSISATYNGGAYSLTASAAVAYGSKDESRQAEKDSIAHSMAVTRTASTRTKKEHQTSFKVSSVAGAEDLAVQVITNASTTEAMRVDYYQLLRKWRVDLIRYGLRMTYDLVIPNPGIGLISKLIELSALNQSILAGNSFTLDPVGITRGDWQELEKAYGVAIEAPPVETLQMMRTAKVPGQSYDKWGSATVQFTLPDGYTVTSGHFRGLFSLYDYNPNGRHLNVDILGEPQGSTSTPTGEYQGADAFLDFDLTTATLVGRTGEVFLVFEYHNIDYGDATVSIEAQPTLEAMQAWQGKVWAQLHEADQANFEARMVVARDRKAQIEAEIAQFDALTLRKMEREEVMKGVIQWLLGPHFALMPDDIRASIAAHVVDADAKPGAYAFPVAHELREDEWHSILDQGELIKFLHNAIEWENVIFFAYPYFWDRAENFDFKRFLMHPDPVHRDFLRAGYTRVVLPVRPGFETCLAMLMETGDATLAPDAKYPYVSIGEEVRNFAKTNYEAIPPANPDRNVRTLLYPVQRQAWQEIQNIMQSLEQYRTDNTGTYPPNLTDPKLAAAAAKAGVKLSAADPFGAPYNYRFPGIYGDYDLWTTGTATQPAVDGLDGVISSWAEGSVVGRWYEYTPTSALDVAVTMIPLNQAKLGTQPSPA